MEMMNHRVVWIGRGPKDHLGLTRRKPDSYTEGQE